MISFQREALQPWPRHRIPCDWPPAHSNQPGHNSSPAERAGARIIRRITGRAIYKHLGVAKRQGAW